MKNHIWNKMTMGTIITITIKKVDQYMKMMILILMMISLYACSPDKNSNGDSQPDSTHYEEGTYKGPANNPKYPPGD